MRSIFVSTALLLAAVSAAAVTLAPGDVALTMIGGSVGCAECLGPPIRLLSNDARLKGDVFHTYNSYIAFAPNGHLFIAGNAYPGAIVELDSAFSIVRQIPRPGDVGINGIAIGTNGDLYVWGDPGNPMPGVWIFYVLSPLGAIKKSFVRPYVVPFGGGGTFDLAPDQCTVFYDGQRFDTCSGQALAPAAASGPVRALSGGGYILGRNGAAVTLAIYDANDRLVRTLTPQIASVTALAFDLDPRYIWAGTHDGIAKLRLDNGAVEAWHDDILDTKGPDVITVAVAGETRPSASEAVATNIPTLSPTLLTIVGIALTALAWHRLGRAA